jgi:hypothetical protein
MREREVTGSRFANEADRLPRVDRKRDAIHRDDRPPIGLEFDPEILDRHQRSLGVGLRCEKRLGG